MRSGAVRIVFTALSALTLLFAACRDDVVSPTTGTLEVRISGLPAGTAALVTVTGPGGYLRTLTATTTIPDLPLGRYSIAPAVVTSPDGEWTPTPATQEKEVTAGSGPTLAEVAYAVSTARLAVNITGLPNGVNADVRVTGPGYNSVLTSSTAINFLTPGTYTVTAADVTSGGTTYRPAPTTQTIQLPASTTQVAANVVYAPVTGSLIVTINGLATGVLASVAVTGPGGYSQQLTVSQALSGLQPGDYTITASNVDRPDGRWAPTPVTQTVTVVGGATAAATVTYALVTARLTINITGLPTGVGASVVVTGPGGFSQAVTETTILNMLTPGSYTITAGNVSSGGNTYQPTPATQTIQLAASPNPATVTVAYSTPMGALTVTINGFVGNLSAPVQVTGPPGYFEELTGTQTLAPLAPGTYTVTASPGSSNLTTHNPTPATQNVTVTAGATATATVTYVATPLSLAVQQVTQGLVSPVYLTAPFTDTRLFIVEQPGRIRIFKNGALLPTPFLDISSRVVYAGEQGLLSMAFDPAYATNGRFYVYYTGANGDIFVDRHTVSANPDVANTAFDQVITIQHRLAANHNGGLVMFGPDGMLYLGTGDGGGGGDPQNNGQNINSLLGKLLRLNVASLPYAIPAGNPFVGVAGADEIWAYGLRNPWRYSFDPPEARLYLADVGQNEWEEVNVVATTAAGVNYGWRIMEGAHCYNAPTCNAGGLTQPVLEYGHGEGCSITGGFVYRGTAIPELNSHYLYSDYCSGFLRSFRLSAGQAVDRRTWAIGAIGSIFSFGVDGWGEMYMLSSNGSVYRIVKQ